MNKICKKCNEEKNITEFYTSGKTKKGVIQYRGTCKECDKLEKRVPLCDRVVPPPSVYKDEVYKKCKRMAYDARSRVLLRNRKAYFGLIDPYGFKNSTELKWYLYNNFYGDIKKLLDEGEVPSIDRIDTKLGYTPDNIRIISFKHNTELGLSSIRKGVEMETPEGIQITFKSVTDCAKYFGIDSRSTNKVSSWVKGDGKYKIPYGYKFRYTR